MKRSLALFLAVLMLAVGFAACADGGKDPVDTKSGDSAETELDDLAARYAIPDDLPDVDYGDTDFVIYSEELIAPSFYIEESNGEVVNDAVVDANRAIEERFGINFVIEYSGLGDNDHCNQLAKLALSGDATYDLTTGHDALCGNLALNGYFTNLHNIPNLNFEKPWWHAVEEHTVLGQYYCGISDMSYTAMAWSKVIFFNKDKLADWNIENPYQLVFDGTWTLDTLISYSKDVYQDLNNNNEADAGDFYGFSTEPECYGFLESFDLETTIKDDVDVLTISFDQDRMITLIEKLHDWLFETKGAKSTMVGNGYPIEEFKQGELLFAHGKVEFAATTFRFVEKLNYGILPVPKFDDKQEDYITMLEMHPVMVLSGVTEDRYERIGTILEAMSAEGYRRIYPAYYEIALKQKYTLDDESIRVLEIVNDTKRASFSWMYENWEGFNRTLYNMVMDESDNFSSYYESKRSVAEKRVDLLVDRFTEMAP